MYLKYYGLNEVPFHITPDPEFLYLSPSHKEALGLMVQGVAERSGLTILTGAVGVGKTTIVRTFQEHCRKLKIRMISVLDSRVTFADLMNMLYKELGLETGSEDAAEQVHGFYRFLSEEQKQGRTVVLVIDEAQNMSINTLEDFEMLFNLDASQDKLLQIVLVGQTELGKKLKLPELKHIQQNIGVRIRIDELTPDESFSYIRHRLVRAGMQDKETTIFTSAAMRFIVNQSQGIPRKINIICDNALSSGFAFNLKPIPEKIVKNVIADLDGKQSRISVKWVVACASLALLFLVVAGWAIVRVLDLPKRMETKHSQSVATIHGDDSISPAGAASPNHLSVPTENTSTQSAPDATALSGSRSISILPESESQKLKADTAAGQGAPVPPQGDILPQGQDASRALPEDPALISHRSVTIDPIATIPGAAGRADEKPPQKNDKKDGKTAEPADSQKMDKQARSRESSGPDASTVSTPGTGAEEASPDPNKLMDWFLNKRGR